MATYKVLVGLDYAGNRVEPNSLVDDLPSKSVPWLLEQGLIEKVEGTTSRKREPESPSQEA